MKLHERLRLTNNLWDYQAHIKGVEIVKRPRPTATDFERACDKFNLPARLYLLALACYYSDESELAKAYGKECIQEGGEFFFGAWREEFLTPEGMVNHKWWKRELMWMEVFEAAVLWGSVLGLWSFLERVGRFPEPDNYISDSYTRQERDLYVLWAAFIRKAEPDEITHLLAPLERTRNKACRLVLALIRAGLERNANSLQKALEDWLVYYRKWEFAKQQITKKITIEGTFFVHWAEKEGLDIVVPAEYRDHIVRLSA